MTQTPAAAAEGTGVRGKSCEVKSAELKSGTQEPLSTASARGYPMLCGSSGADSREGRSRQLGSRELQRTIGNQAVLRMLQREAAAPKAAALGGPPNLRQTDRSAPESQPVETPAPSSGRLRRSERNGAENSVGRLDPSPSGGRVGLEDGPLSQTMSETFGVAEAVREATIENGAALPVPATLPFDLAHVRMRDDANADRSARLLGAHAFAFGNQILFRRGRYEPNTERGRALIVHELTHVAHQSQTRQPHPQRLVSGDVLSVQYTEAMAQAMTEEELSQQMQILRAHLQSEPGDAAAAENLAVLESVATVRQGTAGQAPGATAVAPQAAQPVSTGAGGAPAAAAQPSGGLTTGEKVLIGVLIAGAVVGGVAIIVASGGAAAPAVITGLEVAGDAVVGTELAAGTTVVGEAVAGGEAAVAGTTTASGLTAGQAAALGTAGAAAATPQGQQVLEETGEVLESLAPMVEGEAESLASEAQSVAPQAQAAVQGVSTTPEAAEESAASVADKLDRYLLNPEHEVGGPKADWFRQALGFTRENAADLAKQLVFNASQAVQTAVTQYGTKFNQTINVVGANGRTIPVITAWIVKSDGVPRLVTAVPGD